MDADKDMLKALAELQAQLEDTRAIMREVFRFMGDAFEQQDKRNGTAIPVTAILDPGDGSACGSADGA